MLERQYYPISTSLGVRTRGCSALRGSAPTQQDRDWLVAEASEPASAPTRRQRALGNSIRSRIAPMPPAAVGHMRRLSRRRPVGQRCALPRRDVDVVHGGGREVERRLGATDARVRRASCTVAQVVVSGGPSGTRPCKRSTTSTSSVSSTRSAASARLSRCSRCPLHELVHQVLTQSVQLPFQVALTHLLGFTR